MLDDTNPIEELVHLYVEGAFSRRELMERVSKYAGGFAAAALALAGLGIGTAEAQATCGRCSRPGGCARDSNPACYAGAWICIPAGWNRSVHGSGATAAGLRSYDAVRAAQRSDRVARLSQASGFCKVRQDRGSRILRRRRQCLGSGVEPA